MRYVPLIVALLLTPLHVVADDRANNRAEIARTWAGALAFAPAENGPLEMGANDLVDWLSQHPATPVIVYGHGCDGLSRITRDTGRWFTDEGYAFIAPDSFARLDKPQSCDPSTHRGGMHRGVLAWRQAEVGNAIVRIRLATDAPVVLMGHSQGAVTTATYQGEPVEARIIEGWTCHAGWPEYRGLNAPASEPVLSLLAADDPWFRAQYTRGDCGQHMDRNDQSIVYRKPGYLHNKHWLSFDRDVRNKILDFLDERVIKP